MNESKSNICKCGKNLKLLNRHNYTLHMNSCKKRKNVDTAIIKNEKISKFFHINTSKYNNIKIYHNIEINIYIIFHYINLPITTVTIIV